MAKYEQYRHPTPKRRQDLHPIWRGIGCLIMLIVPVMSFAAADILVNIGVQMGWPIPYQLLRPPGVPGILWRVPTLAQFLEPVLNYPYLYAVLVGTLLLTLILSGILSLGYAILYQMMGLPQYGPYDVPPPKHKPKPYRR